MPDLQKLLHKPQYEEMMQNPLQQQIQQENIYADSMMDMQRQTEALQQSRFKFWGITHKDSQSMQSVKGSMAAVNNLMQRTISQDDAEFAAQLRQTEQAYDQLIDHCRSYLESHRKPFSASGKERRRLVQSTMKLAEREQMMLRDKATVLKDTGATDLIWGNVLGEIRQCEVDLNQYETSSAGAGTSELTVIKSQKSTIFFKEEEGLLTPTEEVRKQYTDKLLDEQLRPIMEGFLSIMSDDPYGMETRALCNDQTLQLLKSEQAEEQRRGILRLQSNLKDFGITSNLDWSDEQVQKLAIELLPRYAKWVTRSAICATTGIENHRPLSTRNVATSRMAMLLHTPDLVAASEHMVIHRGGEEVRKGIGMAEAKGTDLSTLLHQARVEGKPLCYTPESLRCISNLQLFDTICGQIDRNTGNRFFESETMIDRDGRQVIRMKHLQGIDNDMAFGTLTYQDLTAYDSGTQELPTLEVKGKCTLAALDGQMVASIFALSDELVQHTMADLLTEKEINALLDRLHGVQDAIRRFSADDPYLIVDRDKWDLAVAKRFKDMSSDMVVAKSYIDLSQNDVIA